MYEGFMLDVAFGMSSGKLRRYSPVPHSVPCAVIKAEQTPRRC
jgi:hypothetical protein